MRPKKTKLVNVPKKSYVCYDGPLAGHTLWLVTAFTLPMTFGGRSGRYALDLRTKQLTWEPA